MSYMRRHSRPDEAQPEIVRELRKLGYHVEVIGRPTDILVRSEYWPINRWALVEVKTPGRRPDPRQRAQAEFCARHRVPKLTQVEDVLAYLRTLPWELS